MKVIRKEKKKNKNIKQKAVRRQYVLNRWTERSKKYSGYPYIVTVSWFRKNIYLTATDLRGRVKLFGNPGRLGYKGSDKKQFIVVLAVAQKFFKRLLAYKIRNIFLKFKNFRRTRFAIKKIILKLQLLGKTNRYYKPKRFKKKYRPSWYLLPNLKIFARKSVLIQHTVYQRFLRSFLKKQPYFSDKSLATKLQTSKTNIFDLRLAHFIWASSVSSKSRKALKKIWLRRVLNSNARKQEIQIQLKKERNKALKKERNKALKKKLEKREPYYIKTKFNASTYTDLKQKLEKMSIKMTSIDVTKHTNITMWITNFILIWSSTFKDLCEPKSWSELVTFRKDLVRKTYWLYNLFRKHSQSGWHISPYYKGKYPLTNYERKLRKQIKFQLKHWVTLTHMLNNLDTVNRKLKQIKRLYIHVLTLKKSKSKAIKALKALKARKVLKARKARKALGSYKTYKQKYKGKKWKINQSKAIKSKKWKIKQSKAIKSKKWKKKQMKRRMRVKFLGIWTELHVSFNGCRKKKVRRKRKRRRPRRRRMKLRKKPKEEKSKKLLKKNEARTKGK